MHRFIGRISRGHRLPPVIGYHRVVEDFAACAETYIPSLLISVRMLENHIDWLARRYRFIDLNELGSRLGTGQDTGHYVALTFDDGYRDFYDLAFPLLQKKGIPAALFVVTDLVGTSHAQRHDLLYSFIGRNSQLPREVEGMALPDLAGKSPFESTRILIETLPAFALQSLLVYLSNREKDGPKALEGSHSVSWDMIDHMRRSGIIIGSHTKTHALLPNEVAAVAYEEAAESRSLLEERLHQSIAHFAYPSGAWDDGSVEAVAAAGYKYAFTTCGHQSPEQPLLTIPRTLLWERCCVDATGAFSGPVLECLIEGAFDPISGCRRPHRREKQLENRAAA